MKSSFLFIAAALLPVFVAAQKIQYPPGFTRLLGKAGLEFLEPLEAGYRDIHLLPNEFQNCQFAIRSRKEGLQIRFFIMPWDEDNPLSLNPHVATFRILTTVATNADEAVISAIRPTREDLEKDFNAGWGMVYFFQPKPGFSDQPRCRMLALSKEGKGTAFIFYLFDDPGNVALDLRYHILRFW
ncbi:MAG: hypothetical protein ACE5FF_12510 [Saprospiraceae bacterium]